MQFRLEFSHYCMKRMALTTKFYYLIHIYNGPVRWRRVSWTFNWQTPSSAIWQSKGLGQILDKNRKWIPNLSKNVIQLLLPFLTTYLAETGFSALTAIKNEYRNQLQSIDVTLRIALVKSIEARIDNLVNKN